MGDKPERYLVRPLQQAMPVLLFDKAAVEQWLTGSNADALTLQRPAPDEAIEVLPIDTEATLR